MMDNPDEQRAIVVALGREMMRQRLAQTADVDWELPRPLYRHAVELGILQDEYQRPFALLNSNLSPIAMWPSSDFSFISKIERKAKVSAEDSILCIFKCLFLFSRRFYLSGHSDGAGTAIVRG